MSETERLQGEMQRALWSTMLQIEILTRPLYPAPIHERQTKIHRLAKNAIEKASAIDQELMQLVKEGARVP